MTDWNDLTVDPDPGFRSRLEADLLRSLHGDGGATERSGGGHITIEPGVRPDRTRRAPWPLIAAAAVLITAAGIAIVVARSDSAPDGAAETPVPTVRFDVVWPELGGLERPECLDVATTYVWAQAGHCLRQFTGEATITGGVEGSALWSMSGGVGSSDDADATADLAAGFGATYLVRADIVGCGSGEFVMTSSLSFVGWQAGGFVGEWQIIPGSGRDDLVDVAGSGEVLPQVPSGELDANLPRPHVGTITC